MTHVVGRKLAALGEAAGSDGAGEREGPAAGRDAELMTIDFLTWGTAVALSAESTVPEDSVSPVVSGSGDGGGRFATSAKSSFEHDMLTILGLMVVFFAWGSYCSVGCIIYS